MVLVAEADRLDFALSQLRPADWEAFERLCSVFVAEDFPDLRVIAGIGDEGRDAVLDVPARPRVVVQYSIAKDWRAKINGTLRRLKEAGHPCEVLVYVTNQSIGPQGDGLQNSLLLDEGINLDVRDRAYFLSRIYRSAARSAAAEALSQRIITPLLPGDALVRHSAVADPDMRAGLLYLELQMSDVDEGRNITKLSIDNIVLAALRDTETDNRRTRDEIVRAVSHVMPRGDPATLKDGVEGSLARLKGKERITFSGRDDSFALHFRERKAREEKAVELLAERESVRHQLKGLTEQAAAALDLPFFSEGADGFVDVIHSIFELILESQGNRFAEAVRAQTASDLRSDVLTTAQDAVTRSSSLLRAMKMPADALVELAVEVVTTAFVLPAGPIQGYLRQLADAYNLFAFMQEAPDVQRAVTHFFSRGELLLDTTVILPCFGETLLAEEDRRYTNLLRGALDAGMTLDVTGGVLNEIDAHFNLCLHCYRMSPGEWLGSIPLVYADYSKALGTGDFPQFVEKFRGRGGEADIQLFLEQALDVNLVDLDPLADTFPLTARGEVAELWRERKRIRASGGEMERDILLRHDLEMYFGTLGRRRKERADLFGYEAWWVTADATAVRMFETAKAEGSELSSNPCMTPNFLTNLLAIGPTRGRIERGIRNRLPVALDVQRHGYPVPGLSARADEIRASNAGEPEWLIRRRIRDRMNELKDLQVELEPSVETATSLPSTETRPRDR